MTDHVQTVHKAAARFAGLTVLLGVSGGIAAYKACELVRALQDEGARVKVIMTENATAFVGPASFQALTHEAVVCDLFEGESTAINHIALAQECDVFVIAPCTANMAAKLAHGIADDLMSTTALATRSPIVLVPAMNDKMYDHPATQENFARLQQRNVLIIEAQEGYLACGDVGRGRFADLPDILAGIAQAIDGSACTVSDEHHDLEGLCVLITAGPTREPIDAVRFISNRSSGKMGYALAEAACARKAEVVLVSGPVALDAPVGVQRICVETACEMEQAVFKAFNKSDIIVCTAAVADMRPIAPSKRKLKKGADDATLRTILCQENPDILAQCGVAKRSDQVVVGFAAEIEKLIEHAQEKLERKHADLIIANDVTNTSVFGANEACVTIVSHSEIHTIPLCSKRALADRVLDIAIQIRTKNKNTKGKPC